MTQILVEFVRMPEGPSRRQSCYEIGFSSRHNTHSLLKHSGPIRNATVESPLDVTANPELVRPFLGIATVHRFDLQQGNSEFEQLE